jgi:hypothetical protein
MAQKLLYILILLVLTTILNKAVGQVVVRDSSAVDTLRSQMIGFSGGQNRVDSLIGYAYTFMGDRYRRGGTSPPGLIVRVIQ